MIDTKMFEAGHPATVGRLIAGGRGCGGGQASQRRLYKLFSL